MSTIEIKTKIGSFFPGKVLCVGRNYEEHAKELGNAVPDFPLFFMKPSSNLAYSGAEIEIPSYSDDMHYETELVLLIGKNIKNVDESEAEDAIIGYASGFDMTLRDQQNILKGKGYPWEKAKCFDNAAVLSDFVLKEDLKLTLDERIVLHVNGELKQNGVLKDMIFKPAAIVSEISKMMTIEIGDLVFTGTPAGVGRVVSGDKMEGFVTGLPKVVATVK
jgi:5-carboxymethyl-2-hydroxymuconate isomerase